MTAEEFEGMNAMEAGRLLVELLPQIMKLRPLPPSFVDYQLQRPVLRSDGSAISSFDQTLDRLACEGKVVRGLPNTPDAYARVVHRVPAGFVERLIDEDRDDR